MPPEAADAVEAARRVLDGRSSMAEAAGLLRRPLPSAAHRHVRHGEVQQLTELIDRAEDAGRVEMLTELAAAAAAPVADPVRAQVLARGATRLMALHAPEPALALLAAARPLLSGDELMQLETDRLRLHALCDLDDRAAFERDLPGVAGQAERLGSDSQLCMVLYDRAVLAARAGDAPCALESVREARRLRARVPTEDAYAHAPDQFALQHARIARQNGRLEEALGALEDMRKLALAAGRHTEAAWARSELGITWDLLGDSGRAGKLLRSAAAEAEQAGRGDLASHWRHEVGDAADGEDGEDSPSRYWQRASALMLGTTGRAEEAVPLLRKAIADARDAHHADLEADARNMLAAALEECGQPEQAQMALRTAIATARRSGDALREVRYGTNLARVLMFDGGVEEAQQEIESVLALGERLRASAATVELSQSVAITLARAYDTAILIAAGMHKTARELGEDASPQFAAFARTRPDALVRMGQRARAATMTEALRIGRVVEADGGSAPELVSAMLDLRAGEAAVQLAAARVEDLSPALAARDRSAARLREAAGSAGVSLTVGSVPVGRDDLAAALAPDEVLVDLLTVPEGVVVTVLTPAGECAVEIVWWPEDDRRRMVKQMERACRERVGAHRDDVVETRLAVEAAVDALDAVLLTTVADTVRAVMPVTPRRMLVSPENELFHLPYWRLSARLDDCTVSILPTPGALPLLRARRRDGRRPWISVGDPSGTLRHAAQDLPAGLGYRPCAPETGALLRTLPAAGRVHFACHGHFEPGNSLLSGLDVRAPAGPADPLGMPPPAGPDAPGRFTVAQISGRLHLPHCSLVVLSACTSGLPRVHPASEFTSLPGAFLMSGARNVVASLWFAQDKAAALLMRAFYDALDGSPSAALVAARRRLAATGRAEAAELLGTDDLPPFDPPFAETVYTDCFQHYGVD